MPLKALTPSFFFGLRMDAAAGCLCWEEAADSNGVCPPPPLDYCGIFNFVAIFIESYIKISFILLIL